MQGLLYICKYIYNYDNVINISHKEELKSRRDILLLDTISG